MNLFPFPILAVFGWDDLIYLAILLGTTAATTYASYSATTQAADRQAKMLKHRPLLKRSRQRRSVTQLYGPSKAEQRRFRQQQAAAISGRASSSPERRSTSWRIQRCRAPLNCKISTTQIASSK